MAEPKVRKAIVKTAALAVPEVAIPAQAASIVGEKVAQVLTGDLIVIRKAYANPKSTKKHPLPPIEVEYHVNPAGIGIGAITIGLAGLAGVVAWNGIQTLGGGLQGIKNTGLGEKISMRTGGTPAAQPGWFPALDQAIADFKHLLGLP